MAKKKKPSWKDVIVELKSPGGLANVAELGASRPVLREAMRQLETRGEDFSDLEDWCKRTHGFGLHNRGKRVPVAGDERVYKVQGYPDGAPYAKTPLNTLGLEKGAQVKVTFGDDQIVLSRP